MRRTVLPGLVLLTASAWAQRFMISDGISNASRRPSTPLMRVHHSFAAEYSSNPITLNGTIIKFEWMNPHTRIYLNVPDASGSVTKWECEGGAPGGLVSNGWNKESLIPGDHVTIEGFPAKDRSNVCKARAVKLANGRRLLMGSTAIAHNSLLALRPFTRYLAASEGSENLAASIVTFGW